MTSTGRGIGDGFTELARRYEKWRQIAAYAGYIVPDEPAREGDRLNFRYGYPNEGWTGRTIAPRGTGFDVYSATTERRVDPAVRLEAHFSRFEDAGKFILWNNAEGIRMHCGLPPVTRAWRTAGLNPGVEKRDLTDGLARYALKNNPAIYLDAYAGGIKPENHLLVLSYDDLDAVLLAGMPESVTRHI
ncbi:hypothetical protein [[Mycobacterium] burgundiense]|uniref:Uncharacterized protein n=1 Tax=[Mycobacterium] burgundiense TaxID=3064286 RepID=A0ABM9M3F5_9MYCO|nr:hypothetical protein [Mycolicibacterium sp. MU0053]CAJ1509560.1 hypothetical protein MU0053_004225 [Mycolicibacterium sp. MU0053]